MIIECPSCSTKFNLDDERITSDEVKLRCSRCSHVFTYSSIPEASEPDATVAPEPETEEFTEPESGAPEPEESDEETLATVTPEDEVPEEVEPEPEHEAETDELEEAEDSIGSDELESAEPEPETEEPVEAEPHDASDAAEQPVEPEGIEGIEVEGTEEELAADDLDFSDLGPAVEDEDIGEGPETAGSAQEDTADDDLDFSDLESAFAEDESTETTAPDADASEDELDFSELESAFEQEAEGLDQSEAPSEDAVLGGDDDLDFSELESSFEDVESGPTTPEQEQDTEPAQPAEESEELDFSELEASFEEKVTAEDSEAETETTFEVESESDEEQAEEPTGLEDENEPVEDGELGAPAPAARKKRTGLLLTLLIIVGLVAAGYFLYPKYSSYLPFSESTARDADMGQKPSEDVQTIKDIDLQDVRQYFVNNEKVGELFVIEGKAINRFPKVKELIKIEAELYDAEGSVVQSKQFLCGNTVSLFQLQVLSREELNSLLQAKVGVLTNNTNLEPGAEVPFMTVFYNPPGSVQEFGLKVIEAKDPPKQ